MSIACETGVIHGLTEILGSATGSQIEPMDTKSSFQRRLGKTSNVPSFGRTFQAMQEDNLPARSNRRLLLQGDNRCLTVYFVQFSRNWILLLIQSSPPEVSCNG